jgi:hypothetical protein
MNYTPNKYAFTTSEHFIKLLNEHSLLDKELYIKILTQYKSFDSMYIKIAEIYKIKNKLDLRYVRNKLINLNKSNLDFIVIPIIIETNPIKDDAIYTCLLNKLICGADKYEIQAYFFNKTCVSLGWFC